MRVLVTGGAGFIGSYVCDELLREGHEVRVLDNLTPQVHGHGNEWPSYLTNDTDRIIGDVRDLEVVRRALEECDAVVHLAAAVGVGQSMYEIDHYCSVNVMGTAVLLEAILEKRDRIQKLVVASSMSIYGEGAYRSDDGSTVSPSTRPLDQLERKQWELLDAKGHTLAPLETPEDKPLQPESIYAINKRDQEEMCLVIGRAYGIPTVAFRMFNVFGARQALSNPYTGVAAIFCSRLLNRQPPLVYEDGKQRRDFVHVEDVARAYVAAVSNPGADGYALNLGSGVSIDVLEIANTLARVMNVPVQPEITGKYRPGDIRHCFGDISLIREKLGWIPRYTFQNGVDTLVEWVLAQKSAEDKVTNALAELQARGLVR